MDFQTPGYEQLELSTQIVIAEALKRGLKVEVLDESDQFIRISNGKKTEYLRQSNQSSADSYISYHIMDNKWVQKQLLLERGIQVPQGKQYLSASEAINDFKTWEHKAHVIKPKANNFGIGISIMEAGTKLERFTQAVEFAFKEDPAILIEDFIEGKEYRFLVIGGQCVAVLNRVPANVVGDGTHSITELVEMKNDNPLRGEGYKTPLERIVLGEHELQLLNEQNLNPKSIPSEGKRVFLRKNSNISTGGDSIDQTDEMHESYKAIAVAAAESAQAQICGVDMIVKKLHEPAISSIENNSSLEPNHAIIELNWNPVMYFHDFPHQGKDRHTASHLLNLLGF